MTTEKFQTYRGDLRAAVGDGDVVHFVTVHPEGLPTALYHLDSKVDLKTDDLPCGGVAVALRGKDILVAGTDRRVYVSAAGKAPRPLGEPPRTPCAASSPWPKIVLRSSPGRPW